MSSLNDDQALRRLIDKDEIRDSLSRYARGVDRGDWDLVRSTYHPDGYDDHGDFKGDVEGLIAWLDERFDGVDNSMHFLGNCLVEFANADLALVETYFVSRRLRPPTAEEAGLAGPQGAMCRQAWGRYVDRFERRDGQWRVAHRTVVLDSTLTSVAFGGAQQGGQAIRGVRSRLDRLYQAHGEVFGAPLDPPALR